ncbi:MAG: exodeoxyribonuclease VII small subunit [Pseudomonadota bacterium]
MSDKAVEDMSFEEAMGELESLVSRLENAQVPLEESISLYDRGAKLKAHCEARLKAAEEKVAAITLGPDGTPTGTKPVDL